MKATLEFELPEEQESFDIAARAGLLHAALWDTAQEVFRPARKHGYAELRLHELNAIEEVNEAISLLEKKFYEILEDKGIRL